MLEQAKLTAGSLTTIAGLSLMKFSQNIQSSLLSAPNNVERYHLYGSYISKFGKPLTDNLISVGADMGGVISVYGMSFMVSSVFGNKAARLARITVLGLEIFQHEIPQLLNLEQGTGTLTDLAIFAIPFLADIVSLLRDSLKSSQEIVFS